MKNTTDCPCCGFAAAKVAASNKGGLSIHCPDCGSQTFARTPKAAGALGKKLSDGSPSNAKPADDKTSPAGDDFAAHFKL